MAAQVTNYKCPACTGPLQFDAGTGMLTCEYCGSSYPVAEIEALYAEEDKKAEEAQAQAEEKEKEKKEEAMQAAAEAAEEPVTETTAEIVIEPYEVPAETTETLNETEQTDVQ